MPELPEVETVCLGLNASTCGIPIRDAEIFLDRTIAHPPTSALFQQGLRNTQIQTWTRRGKYLLAILECSSQPSVAAGWLGVHLRMSGQLLWVPETAPLPKHTRACLRFVNGQTLQFVDQRTFGRLWWIAPNEDPIRVISGLGQLGPEPLSPDFTWTTLASRLRQCNRPLKMALLDQTLIAGLGNIYADEALFLSGLHPAQVCRNLKADQYQKLGEAIVWVLRTALEQGGTTFSDFRHVSGVNGNYGALAWVYRRAGEPCHHCATPIQKIRLGGRSCHFCPNCQPPCHESSP